MLTCSAACGKIIGAEGYTRIVPFGVELPIRVCYSVTLSKLPNGTGGEFCFSGLDGLASVGSTQPALTHSARSALQAMTNVPHDDSPRQLSMFEPIQIPLSKGQIALIDPVDADLVTFKWCAVEARPKRYYAARDQYDDGHHKRLYLHRVVMERMLGRPLANHEHIDHADDNPLNDSRSNLRIATRSQNGRNTKRLRTNTSGYKGVCWAKNRGYWRASITVNGRKFHLGCFQSAEDAHKAYCEAARKYAGEFARFE